MAKAAAKKRNRFTTGTSSYEQIESTRTPSEILELGKTIVKEIGLDDETDTLGRWMCHHVAYLIARASDPAGTSSHEDARKEAVSTILSLWERRTALPGNAYPLARYKYLLRCLSAISPDASIWEGHGSSGLDDLAQAIFRNLTGIANIVLALKSRPPLFERKRQPVPAISIRFLQTLEQKLLGAAETLDDRTLSLLAGFTDTTSETDDPRRASLNGLVKVIEATQNNLTSLANEVNKELSAVSESATKSKAPIELQWTIKVTKRLSAAESTQCIHILRDGGAVDTVSAKRGLDLANKIAVAKSGREIIGIAVLKADRPAYVSRIAASSGSSIKKGAIELGYVAVRSDSRKQGIAKSLLNALMSVADVSLFATTSSNAMKKMLHDKGFRKTGRTWEGKTGRLSLWQRDQAG
jgi:GNAT superfamily N-acetyltransferase